MVTVVVFVAEFPLASAITTWTGLAPTLQKLKVFGVTVLLTIPQASLEPAVMLSLSVAVRTYSPAAFRVTEIGVTVRTGAT